MKFLPLLASLAAMAGITPRFRRAPAAMPPRPARGFEWPPQMALTGSPADTAPFRGWWTQSQSPDSISAHVEAAKTRRMRRALRLNPSRYSVRNASELLTSALADTAPVPA